jgi:carbon storage regulator
MLVLSRRPSQRIVIGDNIVVSIVSVSGDRVKLGFQCPASVPVHREEIYQRIRDEMRLGADDDLCEASLSSGEWL